jgi:hypothetical protein
VLLIQNRSRERNLSRTTIPIRYDLSEPRPTPIQSSGQPPHIDSKPSRSVLFRIRELQGWFVILGEMRIPQGAVRRTEGLADAMFGMRTLRNSAAHRIRAIPIPVLRDMVRQACHITSSFFDDTRHGMLESVLSELNKLANHISLVCDGEVLRGSIFGTLKLSVEENSKYQFVEPDNSIGELSLERPALEKTQESGKDLGSGLPCSSNLDQAPIPFRDVTGRSSKKGQPQSVSSSEETPGWDIWSLGM